MRVVAGAGVTLEPQLAAHAAELYAVTADPSLYEYIDDKGPSSENDLRERLKRLETRRSRDGTEHWLNWIVRDGAGRMVGYVQATVTPDHAAEIAYVLGRAHWRRGLGYAACGAMLSELRSSYGVTRATATLDPDNAASVALLRKLGFHRAWENLAAQEVGYAVDIAH